jgi:hypothetical protein
MKQSETFCGGGVWGGVGGKYILNISWIAFKNYLTGSVSDCVHIMSVLKRPNFISLNKM